MENRFLVVSTFRHLDAKLILPEKYLQHTFQYPLLGTLQPVLKQISYHSEWCVILLLPNLQQYQVTYHQPSGTTENDHIQREFVLLISCDISWHGQDCIYQVGETFHR